MLSRVKLSPQAQAQTVQNIETAAERLTVKKFFRCKTRSRHHITVLAEATTSQYKPNAPEKRIEKRTINGHMLHGSQPVLGLEPAHQFWAARREFQIPKFRRRLMPAWDRLAQSLIQITRPQARVFPAELAFRSMAMFLKILTIVQVAETRAILMPSQMTMNAEGVVGQAVGANPPAEKKSDEKKPDGETAVSGDTPA